MDARRVAEQKIAKLERRVKQLSHAAKKTSNRGGKGSDIKGLK
jgi:hypothetical protein